jgi:PAS domain S-box-containing protein
MEGQICILAALENQTDFEALALELRPVLPDGALRRAGTPDEFSRALKSGTTDLILCGGLPPGLGCLDALKLSQALAPGVPVIVLAEALDDRSADEFMRNGAWDLVAKPCRQRLKAAVLGGLAHRHLLQIRNKDRLARQGAVLKSFLREISGDDSAEAGRKLGRADTGAEDRQIYYKARASGDYAAIYVTPNIKTVLGYDPQEFVADPDFWIRCIHPEDAAEVRDRLESLTRVGSLKLEYRFRSKDGAYRRMEDRLWLVRDAGGRPAEIIGSWADATERKAAALALQKSEARFRHIFESANVGKSITLPAGEVFVNNAFAELLGYTAEDLRSKTWMELTPPEEVEPVRRIIEPMLAGRKDSARFSKRYIRKDGSLLWADVSTVIRRDEKGAPLYFITTIVDISERRQAEENLRESEARFRRIYEESPVAYQSLDGEGRLLDVNPAWLALIGCSREEAIGRRLADFLSPESRVAFDAGFRGFKECGRTHGGEFELQRRDGARLHVTFDGVFVRDALGRPSFTHCVLHDITSRKQAERDLRESEARLKLALAAAHQGIYDLNVQTG